MKNNRGFALMITLAIISVVVALVFTLNSQNRLAVSAAAVSRNQVTLTHMAGSGIHAAMALLIRDRKDSETDSIQEDWAIPEKRAELLADFPFEEGSVDVTISDEKGRIQVNALVALPENSFNEAQFHLWDRLLGFLKQADEDLADMDTNEIINSLKDWIDSGDDDAITGLTGAESAYYEGLDPPYPCRNGPMDDEKELFRIKGIPDALMGGGEEGAADLLDYLSVAGVSATDKNEIHYDGKININTASLPVIAALLPEDYDGYAIDIVNYREEKSEDQFVNGLASTEWYKNVAGLEDLTLSKDLITNASDLFRITATATLHERRLRITALVQRETGKETGKWGCRILRWRID